MAIEIIPKKKEKKGLPVKIITGYLGVLLAVLAVVSAGAFWTMTRQTAKEVKAIQAQIESKRTAEVIDLEQKLEKYYQGLLDFKYILDRRVSPHPIFAILEGNIHPQVIVSGLQVTTGDKKLKTQGTAIDIVAFEQQRMLFDDESMIISSGVSSFTRSSEGVVSFPIELSLSEELFNSNKTSDNE